MPKNKHGNAGKLNKRNDKTPEKEYNTSVTECEDKEIYEIPEKEFERMIIRLLKNTKEINILHR